MSIADYYDGRSLSQEQKSALILRARDGDREARDLFILSFLRYCNALAAQRKTFEQEDLVHEMILAALSAYERALFAKNPFAYMIRVIQWNLTEYCEVHVSAIKTPQSHEERAKRPVPIPVDRFSPILEEILIESCNPLEQRDYTVLYQALERLTPTQRDVIYCRFGLAGHAPESFGEIAKRQGKSNSVIANNQRYALDKLRRLLESEALCNI